MQEDDHYFAVCRYVERNALRAQLVAQAEAWRWSGLWQRRQGGAATVALAEGPLALPECWLALVNGIETEAELAALRRSLVRGTPFGEARWQRITAQRLGLQRTLRRRGRPARSDPGSRDAQDLLFPNSL